jgi:hypothetical protein
METLLYSILVKVTVEIIDKIFVRMIRYRNLII